jgi:hypothetical protein
MSVELSAQILKAVLPAGVNPEVAR